MYKNFMKSCISRFWKEAFHNGLKNQISENSFLRGDAGIQNQILDEILLGLNVEKMEIQIKMICFHLEKRSFSTFLIKMFYSSVSLFLCAREFCNVSAFHVSKFCHSELYAFLTNFNKDGV